MDPLISPAVLPWLSAAVAVVLAVAALLVVRARDRRVADREREAARAEAARLREQLAALEQRVGGERQDTATRRVEGEHLITRLGEPERTPAVPVRIEGRLFADIVARETVVKAAAWTHGVRRALAPETRHRIRFRMRQELKRARKERRAEMKQALREYRARRAAATEDEDAA